MIRLSGKEPDRDIAIEFTGVRPGEKLHEELWGDGETVGETPHPKILAVTRPPIDAAWLEDELGELERLVADSETLELVSKLAAMMKEPRRVGAAVVEDRVGVTGGAAAADALDARAARARARRDLRRRDRRCGARPAVRDRRRAARRSSRTRCSCSTRRRWTRCGTPAGPAPAAAGGRPRRGPRLDGRHRTTTGCSARTPSRGASSATWSSAPSRSRSRSASAPPGSPNSGNGSITRVPLDGSKIETIGLNDQPSAIATGAGYVWVVSKRSGEGDPDRPEDEAGRQDRCGSRTRRSR